MVCPPAPPRPPLPRGNPFRCVNRPQLIRSSGTCEWLAVFFPFWPHRQGCWEHSCTPGHTCQRFWPGCWGLVLLLDSPWIIDSQNCKGLLWPSGSPSSVVLGGAEVPGVLWPGIPSCLRLILLLSSLCNELNFLPPFPQP